MSAGPINLRQLRAIHTRFRVEHDKELSAASKEAGDTGEHYVHERPKFTPRTGELQRKTSHKVIRTRSGRVIRMLNPQPYAAAIDQGSRPHSIEPKRGGRLVFFWAKKGKWVHAKRVHHPGNKPYRFLHDATWVAGRTFERSMRARMQRVASRFR